MGNVESPSFPLPIVDHHAHLREGPSALRAARAFAEAGGTHLFLATQNYAPRPPRTLEDYRAQFETTQRIATAVRREVGLEVFCTVAPYPIDLVHVQEEIGLAKAEALQVSALELAAREVRERRAVAIGEVGRAHFPVPPPVKEALERILREALRVCREIGCPAVLHTEDLDGPGYQGLARMAREAGLDPRRVVKHYAKGGVPPADRGGLTPSYLAKREVVKQAMSEPGPWFLETDFLDDPSRPGMALPLETVPRRVRQQSGLGPRDAGGAPWWRPFEIPFVQAPRTVYGLELERSRPLLLPSTSGPSPRGS
jgi:TatD-related deoxyribonuclease